MAGQSVLISAAARKILRRKQVGRDRSRQGSLSGHIPAKPYLMKLTKQGGSRSRRRKDESDVLLARNTLYKANTTASPHDLRQVAQPPQPDWNVLGLDEEASKQQTAESTERYKGKQFNSAFAMMLVDACTFTNIRRWRCHQGCTRTW